MASTLIDYFASVFTQEDSSTQLPTAATLNEENFIEVFIFMESEILLTINKLKVNKTPGPDNISPRILKEIKK